MFKRLKEKKKLEEKLGVSPNRKLNQSSDEFKSSAEDSDTDDPNGDNVFKSSESVSEGQCVAESDTKTLVDLLTEQISQLSRELAVTKNRSSALESQVMQLSDEKEVLNREITAKTEECQQLRTQLLEYQSIGGEKDDLLMRNAELSSKCKQLANELKAEQQEKSDLNTKCVSLEKRLDNKTNSEARDKQLNQLNETIVKLEQTLVEKNKTIKLQQQRLTDMKKTFLQNQSNTKFVTFADDSQCSSGDERSPRHEFSAINRDNVSHNNTGLALSEWSETSETFQYLRNVVFKYMVSSDYEVALHLVRAISMLLKFTKDEEQLIKETIAWKMSWIAPLMAPKPTLHSSRK